jgi:hypothetical protein
MKLVKLVTKKVALCWETFTQKSQDEWLKWIIIKEIKDNDSLYNI